MIEVHYPPVNPFTQRDSLKIFLAGTIDLGLSVDWQKLIVEFLEAKFQGMPIDIFNPRRKDWDNSWTDKPMHPMLRGQIEWELKYQEEVDMIIMVLLPESKSPISLMELGSFKHKPILVFNPEEFYRFTNVEVFCKKYNIRSFHDWDDFLIALKRFVDGKLLKKGFYAPLRS